LNSAIHKNNFLYFFTFLFILIISSHLVEILCPYLIGAENCEVKYFDKTEGLIKIFTISVVLGPLLETFLFQFIPIEFYYKFFRKKKYSKWVFIGISSIIFGVSHNYNIITIFDAIFAGVLFSVLYIHFKNLYLNGFLFTFLLHALYNLYAFIIDDLLNLNYF
jgi:hypothetical protein